MNERISKRLQAGIAIPIGLLLLVQQDVSVEAWLLLSPFLLIAVVSAWLLALEAILARVRRKPASHLWSALVLALCLGPAFFWVNKPFRLVASAHKLLRNEARYEELVLRAERGDTDHEIFDADDGIYGVDVGPPPRYYFCWGGITDNTHGVVYDASGTLEPKDVHVFGGELIYVSHLWGPWFYVAFT